MRAKALARKLMAEANLLNAFAADKRLSFLCTMVVPASPVNGMIGWLCCDLNRRNYLKLTIFDSANGRLSESMESVDAIVDLTGIAASIADAGRLEKRPATGISVLTGTPAATRKGSYDEDIPGVGFSFSGGMQRGGNPKRNRPTADKERRPQHCGCVELPKLPYASARLKLRSGGGCTAEPHAGKNPLRFPLTSQPVDKPDDRAISNIGPVLRHPPVICSLKKFQVRTTLRGRAHFSAPHPTVEIGRA
jgi:hypothetical protein